MSGIVYATAQTSVHFGGLVVRLAPGQPWDASDPFVKARPELFSSTPAFVHRTAAPVEEATAVPGERRTTKRAR